MIPISPHTSLPHKRRQASHTSLSCPQNKTANNIGCHKPQLSRVNTAVAVSIKHPESLLRASTRDAVSPETQCEASLKGQGLELHCTQPSGPDPVLSGRAQEKNVVRMRLTADSQPPNESLSAGLQHTVAVRFCRRRGRDCCA